MKVRAIWPCFVANVYREAGEVFEWRNLRQEPLPACMESLEPVASATEPEPVETPEPVRRGPGRPRKQA